ncbi:MAG: hypothetical protein Q8T13_08210 [Acidobacteriota bacterium]|nr:hypothetical protein [Acidobacteriota bacterium]
MDRRSVRISLFILALLASAALGYRAMTDEGDLVAARQRGAALDQAAEEVLTALLDARGSMYAYIAPGQGTSFWGGRAGTLLDTLRQRVVTLDAEVAGSGGSLSESLDGIDQLAAADRRARQYADRGEMLLAGDVLFTEVRDLLNGLTEQVTAARYALRNQSDARVAAIRQEQAALAAAGIGLWVLVSLMLLPGSKREAVKDPTEWRQELATTLKVTPPADVLNLDIKKAERDEVLAPVGAAVAPAGPDLKTVAEICSDLSALADIGALSGALARASDSLGAKGLIVWVTSNDGSALSPVSTHGFDARIVDRIGTIDRASANLTAEALRENAPRVSAATATAGAAIAVPMCGPSGPVGVLSAELHAGKTADEASVAIASIFAAQLATLTAPLPAAAKAEQSVESAAS